MQAVDTPYFVSRNLVSYTSVALKLSFQRTEVTICTVLRTLFAALTVFLYVYSGSQKK